MEQEYKDYLNKRSKLALIYRDFYLYPKLERNIIYPCIDIGFGIGDFLKFSQKTVFGVDINNQLVHQSQKEGLKVGLISNNKIPSNDAVYNAAILDNVLEHISEPKHTLQETYRILSPNAKLIIGVPGIKGYASDSDHKIYYDDQNIIPLLNEYSFYFEKKIIMPLPLKFLTNVLKIYCTYYVFRK